MSLTNNCPHDGCSVLCHIRQDDDDGLYLRKYLSECEIIFRQPIEIGALFADIIMRSNSELLIFMFGSAKKMGLLMQSDFAKSDGIKSDLRIRWRKSSDFGPKSDDSTHRFF